MSAVIATQLPIGPSRRGPCVVTFLFGLTAYRRNVPTTAALLVRSD